MTKAWRLFRFTASRIWTSYLQVKRHPTPDLYVPIGIQGEHERCIAIPEDVWNGPDSEIRDKQKRFLQYMSRRVAPF